MSATLQAVLQTQKDVLDAQRRIEEQVGKRRCPTCRPGCHLNRSLGAWTPGRSPVHLRRQPRVPLTLGAAPRPRSCTTSTGRSGGR